MNVVYSTALRQFHQAEDKTNDRDEEENYLFAPMTQHPFEY